MSRKNIIILSFAAVSIFTMCKPESPIRKNTATISAEISIPQGAVGYEKYFVWDGDASVGLFSDENQNVQFNLSAGAGRKSALLEGVLPSAITEYEKVYAYYPYKKGLESSDIDVDLSCQTWKTGIKGLPTGLFVASNEADDPSSIQLSFKSTMPYVLFRIHNAGTGSVSIKSVSLESARKAFAEFGQVNILSDNPVAKPAGALTQKLAVQVDGSLAVLPGTTAEVPMCLIPSDPGQFNVVIYKGDGKSVSVEKSLQEGFQAGNLYFFDVKLTDSGIEEFNLKVANFNIRFLDDNRPDYDYEAGGQPWRFRRPAVKAFFEQSGIDICGLEEVRRTQFANLNEDLGNDWFIYCPGRISGGVMTKTSDESCGVMYRKSRFNLLDHGCFWVSDSPNEVGSMRVGQDSPRVISWLHLEEKSAPGKDLWFFSAHISWAVSANMKLPDQEVETILTQIEYLTDIDRKDFKKSTTPIFLVGDLNNTIDKSPIKTLESLFQDARLTCPETASTYRNTYNAFGNEQDQKILDYIFYGVGTPKAYYVDNSTDYAPDVYFISDHYPVTFELSY